jgi:hypothetical protein
VETWATQRALQALPILYQIPQIAQALDAFERSRRAEARGIETMQDELERQRLFDMLTLLGGTAPSAGGIAAVAPYAATLSQLAAALGLQAGQTWGSLGQLLGTWFYGGWPGSMSAPAPTPMTPPPTPPLSTPGPLPGPGYY